ncbi:MAG: hypothetical protein AAF629_19220 [Chloroflexota bacterium]
MLDKLTKVFFETYTEFTVNLGENDTATLNVVEVKALNTYSRPGDWGESDIEPERESFTVVLRGSHEQQLEQRMYTIKNKDANLLEDIFLVPISQDSKGVYYELIFN